MSERLIIRQRRRELLITLSFSAFTAMMLVATYTEDWPFFYVPLLLVELILVWWAYSQRFKSYMLRAFVLTLFITLNVFLYGIQAVDFFVVIPTLCVEFVLLSLYEIPRIMDIAVIKSALLFVYHLFVKGYKLPATQLEQNRIILQSVSYIVLVSLSLYRIYHHQQEEEDTVALEEQVKREKQIREDFIANTSHELRTPVNSVSGLCDIILQKDLPEDIRAQVMDIQMTGTDLKNIVTDVLDFAALETDTLTLHSGAYRITSVLNEVMTQAMSENRIKQLEIIFDCDPNIPGLLEGDEQQIERILKSLVGNAIKYTQEGGIVVRVSHRDEAYGINLIVSVKDTGMGLSTEDQELILKGFYQSDMGRSRKNSGLGLGLPITAALIKKMGGFLIIKSEPGVGSEFSFAIPQKVVNREPSVSLLHPGAVKLIWYCSPASPAVSIRDAFAEHIRHLSEAFGIVAHRATSLEECKRRLSLTQRPYLILGREEYLQDKPYFDRLSEQTTVIVVAEQGSAPETAPRIHLLYKPYNAYMLADILNGSSLMSTAVHGKALKRFVAPSAKILVVDDNLMNLKVVEGLLKKYRIQVVTALSGEEALSLIESQDYDFVFMDHMMPGMDGVECFHRIREKPGSYYAQVPIIALTANAVAGSREMFLSEGFGEFVAKPIDTAHLNDVLYRFIPIDKHRPEEDISGKVPVKKQIKQSKSPAASRKGKTSAQTGPSGPNIPAKAPAAKSAATAADPFSLLPGIDRESALNYCGSVEDFLDLAQVFLWSGLKYKKELQKSFEEKDNKNYALLAHTVKGTSKTLGMNALAEMAMKQENAVRENRTADLKAGHSVFMEEYQRILDMLKAYYGGPEKQAPSAESLSAVPGSEIRDWETLKKRLAKCLEAFEERAFEETLDTVRGQTLFGRPIRETLAPVLEKVAAFDFEGALKYLKEMGGTHV